MRKLLALVACTAVVWATTHLLAQQQPPAQQPSAGQGRGGRGGGGRGPAPLDPADRTGFDAIFDGKSLQGWDGDPAFWRVEGGAIVGETTAEKKLEQNTFLIYRGGEPADFELKLQFRMNATNSGIQVRSVQIPEGSALAAGARIGKWVLKGYQADIDFDNRFTGMIYEERGTRGFLAPRGVASYIDANAAKKTIGQLERNADELKAIIKPGDWNDVHFVARGNVLVNIVNGQVTAMLVDDDPANRTMKGLIGLQLHVGDPMKIEFRNIGLKKL